jgi:hypothetical protein
MRLQIPGGGIDLWIIFQGTGLTGLYTIPAEITATHLEIQHGKTPSSLSDEPLGTGGDAITALGALFHKTVFVARPGRTNDCPPTVQVTGQELHSAYNFWHNTRMGEIRTELL